MCLLKRKNLMSHLKKRENKAMGRETNKTNGETGTPVSINYPPQQEHTEPCEVYTDGTQCIPHLFDWKFLLMFHQVEQPKPKDESQFFFIFVVFFGETCLSGGRTLPPDVHRDISSPSSVEGRTDILFSV